MAKTDRCVVRNTAYTRENLNGMERHNERKNEKYYNSDIHTERARLNVHFKSCEGTYEQEFDRLLADGVISNRGQRKVSPKIVDEMVFDVNSEYFDRHGDGSPAGGYDYAKEFFEEAYRLAVKEAGGEQFILSAVMHADERNKALSEKLGRDVYHYHLHVVYVPVVDKEIKFRANNKNPELAGKSKGFIKQVSHSKKWPRFVEVSRDGKPAKVNAYSLLQDRYFEHMQSAGYTDFQRGERGSTAEHLDVLDYKIQQDTARLDALQSDISGKQAQAVTLDKSVEKKQERLSGLNEKIAVTKEAAATFAEIEGMAKKTIGGNFQLSTVDWAHVSGLAKEGVKSRSIIKGLKERISALLQKISGLETRLKQYEGQGVTDTMRYYQARQRAPRRMAGVISEIMRQPPEQKEPEPSKAPEKKKTGHEL